MIVFLDTGPLGAVTNPKSDSGQAVKVWMRQMDAAGHRLIVPAIANYELRREHLLRGAVKSLDTLDTFNASVPGRYLPLTDSALIRAAQLWADVRKIGLPTADLRELDCDVLLAAQVLDLGLESSSFIVATGNTRHLSRLVACNEWQNISP